MVCFIKKQQAHIVSERRVSINQKTQQCRHLKTGRVLRGERMARQGAASMFATALLLGVFANISPSDSLSLSLSLSHTHTHARTHARTLTHSLTHSFFSHCLLQHCSTANFCSTNFCSTTMNFIVEYTNLNCTQRF